MRIRGYTSADLEPIVQLFTDSVHIAAAAHYDERQRHAWAPKPPDLERWRQRLASVTVVIAERDGELLGFITYEPDGHIDLLYTSAAHQRAGVASQLYRHVEGQFAMSGIVELYTEASHLARPFFAKQGFLVECEEQVTRAGVSLARFKMRKRVA